MNQYYKKEAQWASFYRKNKYTLLFYHHLLLGAIASFVQSL